MRLLDIPGWRVPTYRQRCVYDQRSPAVADRGSGMDGFKAPQPGEGSYMGEVLRSLQALAKDPQSTRHRRYRQPR